MLIFPKLLRNNLVLTNYQGLLQYSYRHLNFFMAVRTHSGVIPHGLVDVEKIKEANSVNHSVRIAEAMNECLWLGDKNHQTIYVNPVYEKTTGYSLQECLGQPADFCFDEKSKKTIAEHHKLRGKGGASQYEATIIAKNGTLVPVLVSGAPTITGGTIGIFINLTKVKELAKKDKMANRVMQHSDEAIVVLDQNRKITFWNNGAKKVFGYKNDEVLNKTIDIVIPSQEVKTNKLLIKEVEKKGYIMNVETRRLNKDGNLIDVSVSVTKVLDDNRNFLGYLLIYRDITQQKRTHLELQKRFEAIQDAYKELGLQKRHLDYMCEIAGAATSTDTLENLEKLIVSAMCMLTKCDGVILRAYDTKKNALRLRSGFGVSKKWWTKGQISFENSIAEEAFKKRRALIIDDIDTYKKHQGIQLLKFHKFKTLILLPLFIENTFLGSISLYGSDATKFRFIETDFLENMAKQCSLAIHSKRCLKN